MKTLTMRQSGFAIFERNFRLEVSDAAGGEEAKKEGEKYCSDDGDEYCVEEAACSGVAESDHDEAAYDGTDDANDDVDEGAEAGTAHDLSGEESGDEADDEPDE